MTNKKRVKARKLAQKSGMSYAAAVNVLNKNDSEIELSEDDLRAKFKALFTEYPKQMEQLYDAIYSNERIGSQLMREFFINKLDVKLDDVRVAVSVLTELVLPPAPESIGIGETEINNLRAAIFEIENTLGFGKDLELNESRDIHIVRDDAGNIVDSFPIKESHKLSIKIPAVNIDVDNTGIRFNGILKNIQDLPEKSVEQRIIEHLGLQHKDDEAVENSPLAKLLQDKTPEGRKVMREYLVQQGRNYSEKLTNDKITDDDMVNEINTSKLSRLFVRDHLGEEYLPLYDFEDYKKGTDFKASVIMHKYDASMINKIDEKILSIIEGSCLQENPISSIPANAIANIEGWDHTVTTILLKSSKLLSKFPSHKAIFDQLSVIEHDLVDDDVMYFFADPEFLGVLPYKNKSRQFGLSITNPRTVSKCVVPKNFEERTTSSNYEEDSYKYEDLGFKVLEDIYSEEECANRDDALSKAVATGWEVLPADSPNSGKGGFLATRATEDGASEDKLFWYYLISPETKITIRDVGAEEFLSLLSHPNLVQACDEPKQLKMGLMLRHGDDIEIVRVHIAKLRSSIHSEEIWKKHQKIGGSIKIDNTLKEIYDAIVIKQLRNLVEENPVQAAAVRSGKEQLRGFFVGQILKDHSHMEPKVISELLDKVLAEV